MHSIGSTKMTNYPFSEKLTKIYHEYASTHH